MISGLVSSRFIRLRCRSMNLKLLVVALFSIIPLTFAQADDWLQWRGPNGNGMAEDGQNPPTKLEKPKWSVDLTGRSHGTPIVAKGRVYLAAADEEKQTQSTLCFDRKSGKEIWKTVVHEGSFKQKLNKKGTWASSSPATDGERIFVNFVNNKSAFTTALDLNGKQLWQTKICDYKVHQAYGSSPTIYKNLVIVSADNKLGGAISGLDRKTGDVVWTVKREKEPNYPSPIILKAAGKDQLFMTGTKKVTSIDPATGAINWEIDGATTECVTTTVTDGKRIYSSGGYPKNHVAAIEADGSGKISWETKDRVYVPSMLIKDGFLFAVMDSGVAICWNAETGDEQWKARLGGNFSASPILVGENIYAANESGTVYVFKASTSGLEVISEQKIGDAIFASPVICGGQIFLRVADFTGDKRSERLVCFGE